MAFPWNGPVSADCGLQLDGNADNGGVERPLLRKSESLENPVLELDPDRASFVGIHLRRIKVEPKCPGTVQHVLDRLDDGTGHQLVDGCALEPRENLLELDVVVGMGDLVGRARSIRDTLVPWLGEWWLRNSGHDRNLSIETLG